MFGSNILETAIGLIFVYLGFSLLCSGLREWIAVILNTRAKTLKKGILNMLKDENRVTQIFNHHLVRVKKDDESSIEKTPMPKYISAKTFAQAFLENILKAQKSEETTPEGGGAPVTGGDKKAVMIEGLRKSIAKIENSYVKNMLNDMLDSTKKKTAGWEQKCENAKMAIEKWFNDEMELLSAWYKRQTHKVVLGLALVVCIVFNVDTIMITQSLSVNSALRESLATVAMQTAQKPIDSTSTDSYEQGKKLQEKMEQLGLPIGWKKTSADSIDPRGVPGNFRDWLYKIFGLLMSILAVSLGAPFWFDILKKLINLSSTKKNGETPPQTTVVVPTTPVPVPTHTPPPPPAPPCTPVS